MRKPWVKPHLRRAPKSPSCIWKKPACCPSWKSWALASSPTPAPPVTAWRRAGPEKIQQEIIDRDLYATAVLSGNRNFDGRIHPYAKQAFLASPPLVVACHGAGTVRFDIEKDVLAWWMAKEIRLKDLWPSAMKKSTPSCRRRQARAVPRAVYIPCSIWAKQKKKALYDWRPMSTYIRRPPYWDTEGVGALAANPRTLKGMRPLASCRTTSPPTTCRRPTPSCRQAAGEYLAKMGLPEEDFNSYATHRGDHLTAMRATFANPQLVNEMAVVDGR